MAGNKTLTIIKPDAFGSGKAGKIIAHLEQGGFKVKAARVMHMTDKQASAFYEVHRERPFYRSLVNFMTSGPCMPIILEKAGAVAELRKAIGATGRNGPKAVRRVQGAERYPCVRFRRQRDAGKPFLLRGSRRNLIADRRIGGSGNLPIPQSVNPLRRLSLS
jgi:nucleoside diphosphate kinase